MKKNIKIFDTTLRDGAQAPGCGLYKEEKIKIAMSLRDLGVDVIEAGFPISSTVEFESVKQIANNNKNSNFTICAFSRVNQIDIQRCWESVKNAKKRRIHLGIASSDLHLKNKLKLTRSEVVEKSVECIKLAKKFPWEIQFYAEDSTRSNIDFLLHLYDNIIKAGATIINVPDTTGCISNKDYFDLIKKIKTKYKNKKIKISTHCHNDMGLAVSNTLNALEAGADQIECTINGIGERCGNTSLEEIVLNLNENSNFNKKFSHNINNQKLYKNCILVSNFMNYKIPVNKSLVGSNAFATEAGIHADGNIKNKYNYLFFNPNKYGRKEEIVLGARSGKSSLKWKMNKMGYKIKDLEKFDKFYTKFIKMADLNLKKRGINDKDFERFILKNGYKKK